jgi:glycosyltransferase involved in cell wall biosynthesis
MIFFQNPDRQWYKKTISQWVRGARAMNKYEYILDNHLDKGIVNVILPVTGKNKIQKLLNIFLRFFRFYVWIKINGLNYKSFNIAYSYAELNDKDLVFVFFHDNFAKTPCCCEKKRYKKDIRLARCKFLVHLNHYVYNISDGSDLCSQVNNIEFIAETNLYKHSSFFKKYFSWFDKPVKVLPFCVSDRFQYLSGEERIPKAIATGAVTFKIDDNDFINFFGTDILQPERKYLLENAGNNNHIHLSISEFKNFKNHGLIKTLILNFMNYLYAFVHRKSSFDTKPFYSLDLPKFYNQFEFVVCPAEIIGLPGIGAFEAMASGAILISNDNDLYSDYGLKENLNYISYNGTIDDLVYKIKSLLNDEDQIEILRKNSLQIINDNMRTEVCISNLDKLAENYL